MQRPRRLLARANASEQNPWHRRTYPNLKKSPSPELGFDFCHETSFRQDSTLHAAWSRVGDPPEVPVTGERKSVKILDVIEPWRSRFHYKQDTTFNAVSYLDFLEPGTTGVVQPF